MSTRVKLFDITIRGTLNSSKYLY